MSHPLTTVRCMELLLVLAVVISGALGAVGAVWFLGLRERDAASSQAQAVEAAVGAAMRERELTVEAFRVERQATVAAAVDTAVKVAGNTLDGRLQAGSRELGHKSQLFEQQVGQVKAELEKVNGLILSLQRDKAQQHGDMVQRLEATAKVTEQLHGTTNSLREALASPKARGQWGERMAEDVLQKAGMKEGVNYRQQKAIEGGGIPDFTFFLPNGLEVNMDVKFPIDNYLRFLEAENDADRDRFRSAFARDVKKRIKELQGREYIAAGRTIDSVLLFIPNESVYAFIHENDATLLDEALRQKVVLCSPFTLFSVLAVIRQSVENFQLEKTSSDILDALNRFSKQWGSFSDVMLKLGKQMATTQNTFDELTGTRQRVLEKELGAIDVLKAQTNGAEPVVSVPRPRELREVQVGEQGRLGA